LTQEKYRVEWWLQGWESVAGLEGNRKMLGKELVLMVRQEE
jgi:hypothetical protein